MTAYDPCAHCEEVMQPFMDRVLTDTERAEAEAHARAHGVPEAQIDWP